MKKRPVPEDKRFIPTLGGFPQAEERFPFPRFAAKMMHRALSEPVIDVFQTKDEVVATMRAIHDAGLRHLTLFVGDADDSSLLPALTGGTLERLAPCLEALRAG